MIFHNEFSKIQLFGRLGTYTGFQKGEFIGSSCLDTTILSPSGFCPHYSNSLCKRMLPCLLMCLQECPSTAVISFKTLGLFLEFLWAGKRQRANLCSSALGKPMKWKKRHCWCCLLTHPVSHLSFGGLSLYWVIFTVTPGGHSEPCLSPLSTSSI